MSRIKKGRLRKNRNLFRDDNMNPMEGTINIVDAMLVFACGLMLSLVIYWNVDLRSGDLTPVSQGAEVSSAEQLENRINEDPAEAGGLEEVGKVYRDPVTGKLYLAESEAAGGDQDSGNDKTTEEPEDAG